MYCRNAHALAHVHLHVHAHAHVAHEVARHWTGKSKTQGVQTNKAGLLYNFHLNVCVFSNFNNEVQSDQYYVLLDLVRE